MPRPKILGVLNVTPDSFSDGGRWDSREAAVARGLELQRQGADIVDIGGESTRPGSERVPPKAEQQRVVPVIADLVAAGVTVSVDTLNASTAAAAVEAGAAYINDVSGGLADPLMAAVAVESDAWFIASHWRGHSAIMDDFADYADVVAEVRTELRRRLDVLIEFGVNPARLIVDPGLGFAKRGEHNWRLLADLGPIQELGHPLLVGASRKSFLGTLLADRDGNARPVDGRDDATTALSVVLAQAGVWGLRVHDVRSTRDALRVLDALTTTREDGGSDG
jgi:dihydropteroate synthase